MVMSIDLILPSIPNPFNDSLIGGEVFEPVDGDGALKVIKLLG